MARFLPCFVLIFSSALMVNGESTFAGSSISSNSDGTRSVLVTGRNGVVQTRIGNGGGPISIGSGGTYASAGPYGGGGVGVGSYAGPGGAYAGPNGAFASAGGAYAGAGGAYAGAGGPFGFPYGSYASSSAGDGYYPQDPYYDQYPPYGGGGGGGSGVGVYSSSDSNGIQSRFASVGPGGQATIVEQNGNQPPRVYTYRGAASSDGNRDIDN